MQKILSAKELINRRPYASLAIFVIIVVVTSVAGYARYQHVQAELEAQKNLLNRIQNEFDDWRDDFSKRMRDAMGDIQGTAQGAGNIIGGAWGIIKYITKAVLDYIGNLHIMIPVTVIYFGIGFFGALKMRVATLLGALIAFWVSTMLGIVPGSVIGLFVLAGLLFGDKKKSALPLQHSRNTVLAKGQTRTHARQFGKAPFPRLRVHG